MALLRRRIRDRREFDESHRAQLDCGILWKFLGTGWPDADDPEAVAEMQSLWESERDEFIATRAKRFPGTRPWAFWRFDAKRDESIPEAEQIERLGLLTAGELAALEQAAHGVLNEYWEPAFRRMWAWWRFLAPQRRDWSKPEAIQLIELHRVGADVLTDRERYIVDFGRDTDSHVAAKRDFLEHLAPEERTALGLPEALQ